MCVQVAEINVPQVRTIDDAEIRQRDAAIAAFRAQWKSDGQLQLPEGIAEVLRGGAEEGCSSEDTSDEAYAARHRPKEDEERQRFLGISGDGRPPAM